MFEPTTVGVGGIEAVVRLQPKPQDFWSCLHLRFEFLQCYSGKWTSENIASICPEPTATILILRKFVSISVVYAFATLVQRFNLKVWLNRFMQQIEIVSFSIRIIHVHLNNQMNLYSFFMVTVINQMPIKRTLVVTTYLAAI